MLLPVEAPHAPAVGRIPIQMTSINWIQIAEARGIPAPPDALKFTASLDALESAFRPLVITLGLEMEPAIILSEQAVAGK